MSNIDPQTIEMKILDLLSERNGKTICPSEVARKLESQGWRSLMQPVREAAARLALAGRLIATQQGKEVDVLSVRGPVRFKAIP